MNKGHYIGIILFLLLVGMGYFLSSVANVFGGMETIILFAGVGCMMMGGALLFYSTKLEGNVWIWRRFGSGNIGIACFLEGGRFMRYMIVNLSNDKIEIDKQIYRIIRERIIYRAGTGIPYLFYISGIGENIEPLAMDTLKPVGDNKIVTAFIKEQMALWKSLAFQQIQQQFLIALIALGLVMIAGFGLMYFGGIQPLDDHLVKVGSAIIKALPTPVPTPMGAIPNA